MTVECNCSPSSLRPEIRALWNCTEARRELSKLTSARTIPAEHANEVSLANESFVSAWEGYVDNSRRVSAWSVLRQIFVQLHFPISKGISHTDRYRQVVYRGAEGERSENNGICAIEPESIQLELLSTSAGRIAVIHLPNRTDFEQFLQAVCYRNEPVSIPRSVGAQIVWGYNNWDRFHRARTRLSAGMPLNSQSLRELVGDKAQYQDTFIVTGSGPYSGVAAKTFGLDEDIWWRKSRLIRVSHERAHYVSRRFFNVTPNRIVDELIADFAGIVGCENRFSAEWFIMMMGLGQNSNHAGRINWYVKEHCLSPTALSILSELLKHSARNLEVAHLQFQNDCRGFDDQDILTRQLTPCSLWELASGEAIARIFGGLR